jgi:hypothetical protein
MALYATVTLAYYDSLGAYQSIEVTSKTVSIDLSRGKSRQLDYYEPGSVTVVLNNFAREFDPTNDSSVYQPWVTPKKIVDIVHNGFSIFSGLIDDWSFTYDVNGEAFASFSATENIGILANQYMATQSFPAELSGARINRVLDDPGVSWSTGYGDREIGTGTQLLAAETIANNTNALDYLRQIETSEQGALFFNSNTYGIKFVDNNNSINSATGYELFADDGTINYSFGTAGKPSINYDFIDVSYTAQLMYNNIVVNSYDGLNYVIASDPGSQEAYSVNQLNVDGVLYSTTSRLSNLASLLIRKYSNPEYRINSIRINVYALDGSTQQDLAKLQLNDYAKVRFKPNGIGDSIERSVQIIGIAHEITAGSHMMTLQFDSVKVPYLVLNDAEFGKLDTYSLRL